MNNDKDEQATNGVAKPQPNTSPTSAKRKHTPAVRYNVQEMVDMLMDRASKAKDPAITIKAIELIVELKKSGRRYASSRKQLPDLAPDPPNEPQTMTDEQKGVLGF